MKIEVSNGEILDKVSILEIKLERILDLEKVRNIRKEYDRAKSQLDEDDWRRDNAEYPYNQPGSGKTPTELLLNIINTGGGEYPSYRVLSDRSEKYLESRSE